MIVKLEYARCAQRSKIHISVTFGNRRIRITVKFQCRNILLRDIEDPEQVIHDLKRIIRPIIKISMKILIISDDKVLILLILCRHDNAFLYAHSHRSPAHISVQAMQTSTSLFLLFPYLRFPQI